MSKQKGRLDRLFDRIQRHFPMTDGPLRFLRHPLAVLIRIPLGVLLVIGGLLSFLPILGIWMLPLGLAILAIDLPFLQGPVTWAMLSVQRRWTLWRRARRQGKDDPSGG